MNGLPLGVGTSESEVTDFDTLIFRNQNIGWFQISVENIRIMEVFHSLKDVKANQPTVFLRHESLARLDIVKELLQVLTLNVLKDNE